MTLGPTTSALELATALRRRDISAVELLDDCLAAVDARNGEVNAIVWRDDEAARAAARHADAALARGDDAAFLGVPLPIKDLTPVAGWPVTYGSRGGPSGVSAEGELTTEAFKRAGFVLCGRTNTPEFGPTTVTAVGRPVVGFWISTESCHEIFCSTNQMPTTAMPHRSVNIDHFLTCFFIESWDCHQRA